MQYTPDEWTDLAVYLRPHAEDPDGSVGSWFSDASDYLGMEVSVAVRKLRATPEFK